ncbi:hypothetical protein MPSEU_000224600 [Mayamaea pseudoterrestris]|nr:hypothetical protein MPSEU_000224600 [Mayamaea pseudoterrestris]
MISVSLLGNKDQQSSSASLLELDMGSDCSQLNESTSSDSDVSAMDLEDEVLINMLVQLENGMFNKQRLQRLQYQNSNGSSNSKSMVPAAPKSHSQSTPEITAARKFFHQMGESLSCDCMFSAADLIDMSTEDDDDDDDE